MGINIRKRVLIETIVSKKCPTCNKEFTADDDFCRYCGTKLTTQTTKVYANFGKRGITSYSYVLPGGKTINSKGKLTLSVGNGISFTQKI